ncbi:MFS transporter [Microterricola pindariensis]|uniref:MFS transporter n=1 Tax=Microterricola pindariensis TaxID=478010 RepID=A0ABX5AW03_9MICO|nr:MFS transporter [Microterricola pindariensis]PPL19015.1 MFS transporter [Microterricola pindariensis]
MSESAQARAQLPRALRPFRTRQYRILAAALTLSLLGSGMWFVAVVWQVMELGGGPAQLSLVATMSAIGLVAVVLVGGVVADRVVQKRILLVVEASKIIVIGAIAWLALAETLEIWHLMIAALVIGVGEGFFYPAYSAMLPSILPGDDLLAANGFEGMLRPAAMQAAGPALASAAVAAASPALAFVIVGALQVVAVVALVVLRPVPLRRNLEAEVARHPLRAALGDLAEGFRYMFSTPWLLATLLFSMAFVLVIMGPIDVLAPFAVRDSAGGGATEYALVLAAFGVGSVLGALFISSRRMPRRYLTVLTLAWGLGSLPLAVIGFTDQVWLMGLAVFIVGFSFSIGGVIWGTLLQRRVPPHMLGRVSSLDFFVSLAFMPISMALAGPVGEAIGLAPTFVIAGVLPLVFAVIAIVWARLPKDEIAHPLGDGADAVELIADAPPWEPGPRLEGTL